MSRINVPQLLNLLLAVTLVGLSSAILAIGFLLGEDAPFLKGDQLRTVLAGAVPLLMFTLVVRRLIAGGPIIEPAYMSRPAPMIPEAVAVTEAMATVVAPINEPESEPLPVPDHVVGGVEAPSAQLNIRREYYREILSTPAERTAHVPEGWEGTSSVRWVARQALERARGLYLEAQQARTDAIMSLEDARQQAQRIQSEMWQKAHEESSELSRQVKEQVQRQIDGIQQESAFFARSLNEADQYAQEASKLQEVAEQELTRAQALREEARVMRNEAMRQLAGATMSPQEASLGLPPDLPAFPQLRRQESSAPPAPPTIKAPAEEPVAPASFANEPAAPAPPANEVVIPADVPSQAPPSQGAPTQEADPMDLRAQFGRLLASSSMGSTQPTAPPAGPVDEQAAQPPPQPQYVAPPSAGDSPPAQQPVPPSPAASVPPAAQVQPTQAALPASYSGRLSIMLMSDRAMDVVGDVWDAIEELVGYGKIVSSVPIKGGGGLELVLELGAQSLATEQLTKAISWGSWEPIDEAHVALHSLRSSPACHYVLPGYVACAPRINRSAIAPTSSFMATGKAEVDRLYHEFEAARQALVSFMQDLRETPPGRPRMAPAGTLRSLKTISKRTRSSPEPRSMSSTRISTQRRSASAEGNNRFGPCALFSSHSHQPSLMAPHRAS